MPCPQICLEEPDGQRLRTASAGGDFVYPLKAVEATRTALLPVVAQAEKSWRPASPGWAVGQALLEY